MKFNQYILEKENVKAKTIFIPSDKLPEIPITTPFTFPIKGKKVMLAKDKMKWWNPLGGHIEENESWEKALQREAFEEAGVEIKNLQPIGYIKITKLLDHPDNQYPKLSQIPIFVSEIKKIKLSWKTKETFERKMFSFPQALRVLRKRNDNLQMYQIFEYLLGQLNLD